MTIDYIEVDNAKRMARCYWFDRLQATWHRFPLHMLDMVEPKGDRDGANDSGSEAA